MCLSFLTFPQIGVDKGSHGKKIDFSEQVLACYVIFVGYYWGVCE